MMIRHDLHLHTPFSNCGKINPEYLEKIYRRVKEKGYISSSNLRRLLVEEAVKDYIANASKLGLKTLGFTDHYNIDTNPSIFDVLREIIKQYNTNNVEILVGTESNVIDEKGKQSVPREIAEKLDFVIAGQHHYQLSYVKKPPSQLDKFIEYCIIDIINTMRNPIVSAIGHPWLRAARYARKYVDPSFTLEQVPLEYFFKTCEYSEKYDKPIQIDYNPEWEKTDGPYKGYQKFLEIALAYNKCKIFYGSDAHRPDHLAMNLIYVNKKLKEYKVDKERIWEPRKPS